MAKPAAKSKSPAGKSPAKKPPIAEIDAEVRPLLEMVDHRLLNEVEGLDNPTAEIIAGWFLARIRDCEQVRVYRVARTGTTEGSPRCASACRPRSSRRRSASR